MTIEIRELEVNDESTYGAFIRECRQSLFYYGLKYRDFLTSILRRAAPVYFTAWEGDNLVGVLPAFVADAGPKGRVMNSLPFYGSTAGPLVAASMDASRVSLALIEAFDTYAMEQGVLSSCIIMNPLVGETLGANEPRPATVYLDSRIGQFTRLPRYDGDVSTSNALLSVFHQKTRNMVRKGLKSNFDLSIRRDKAAFQLLHELHEENMREIGGLAKPYEVFEKLHDLYGEYSEIAIYCAHKGSEIAGAMLLIYHNDIVEYYTPTISEKYRSDQPLSALIFTAMVDASRNGIRLWNWGGTWLGQEGVYRFKSRWGTVDLPYQYRIRVLEDSVLSRSKKEILEDFPYFYVVPFGSLSTAQANQP